MAKFMVPSHTRWIREKQGRREWRLKTDHFKAQEPGEGKANQFLFFFSFFYFTTDVSLAVPNLIAVGVVKMK